MKDIELVLERLSQVNSNGLGWTGRCPAHRDEETSLSISEEADGTVRLYCKEGCTAKAVLTALDLDLLAYDVVGSQRDPVDLSDLTVDEILAANPEISKDDLLNENPLLKALLAGKRTAASEVVRLIEESGALLFRDAENRAYASFANGDRQETWPIRSRMFKLFARRLFHEASDAAANGQAIADGLAAVEAKAIFDGPELLVHLRLAGDDGVIHLDLGDPNWRAITITRSGWAPVAEHPVRFRRSRGMGGLPDPARGGNLDELRRFLNVAGDDDWRLVAGWLLAAACPPGRPYPVLVLHGEQGSAKSTTAKVLRECLDPVSVPLRAAPRELRDLMISASSSWIVSFDNISHLPPWLSDALCRLATGGGFATRELYSDEDEVIFGAQRPVIINGIEELATRSDLLDRSLLINLPTIAKTQRRAEDDFWADFYEARPRILGGLCDALVSALANLGSTTLETLPRMADFALWVTAAETGLGWEPGSFAKSYELNREHVHEIAIEATLIGPLLVQAAEQGFEGTATNLLALVTGMVDERISKQSDWPKTPRALSGVIKRLAPNLRALGYVVHYGQRDSTASRNRLVRLSKP